VAYIHIALNNSLVRALTQICNSVLRKSRKSGGNGGKN
jgi:hypothetical protein